MTLKIVDDVSVRGYLSHAGQMFIDRIDTQIAEISILLQEVNATAERWPWAAALMTRRLVDAARAAETFISLTSTGFAPTLSDLSEVEASLLTSVMSARNYLCLYRRRRRPLMRWRS